jgi:hypothetical protein
MTQEIGVSTHLLGLESALLGPVALVELKLDRLNPFLSSEYVQSTKERHGDDGTRSRQKDASRVGEGPLHLQIECQVRIRSVSRS